MSLPRRELVLLVKQHLERAPAGLTKHDLLTAIGPSNTSLASIQRALDDLRTHHDADLHYDPQTHLWRLASPLHLPLEDPDALDVTAGLVAQTIAASLGDLELAERLMTLVEDLDGRARARNPTTELPSRKAMSCALTLGTQIDPAIFRTLIPACRRKTLRITYVSPWQSPSEPVTSQLIEPWALRITGGGVYLRAWSHKSQRSTTYRLAHIETAEIDPALPTEIPPADLWDDANPAFGIDDDRPGIAVVVLRGGVARHAAKSIWVPGQKDHWLEDKQLLQRTFAYRSCRELAPYLVQYIKGMVSVSPRELYDEVKLVLAHGDGLRCGDDVR